MDVDNILGYAFYTTLPIAPILFSSIYRFSL